LKLISNITQSYSYNRTVELERFLSKDNVKALELLDIITFSFHNCSFHFKQYAKKRIKEVIPKCIIFEFDNITYLDSIILYLNELKKLNVTDFILWQDDHYIRPYNNYLNIFNSILKYYKNNNLKYLKIFDNYLEKYKDYKYEKLFKISKDINLFQYNINDIDDKFLIYSDENYLMNLDIAIDNIFKIDIEKKDVWQLEYILYENIKKYFNKIYITNIYLFDRYDIHGRNKKPYFLIYNFNKKNKHIVL
jgi:hypothetical protein